MELRLAAMGSLVLVALLALGGCGSDDGGKDESGRGGTGSGGEGAGDAGAGGEGAGGAAPLTGPYTLGEVETLASGQSMPVRLALAGNNVYFANRGLEDQATGSIASVPKAGGAVSVVSDGLEQPVGIAASATTLFYSTYGLRDEGSNSGTIAIQNFGGQPVTSTGITYPAELFVDADYLVFFSGASLMRFSLTGGELTTLFSCRGPQRRYHDVGRIYITQSSTSPDNSDGAVLVWSEQEPEGSIVAEGLADPQGITKAKDQLVVTCAGDGTVIGIEPNTGETEVLASGSVLPWGIAADDQYVYFADAGAGSPCTGTTGALRRFPAGGGELETLASGLPCASTVVVDATGIYWVNNGTSPAASDGSVMKMAKLR